MNFVKTYQVFHEPLTASVAYFVRAVSGGVSSFQALHNFLMTTKKKNKNDTGYYLLKFQSCLTLCIGHCLGVWRFCV